MPHKVSAVTNRRGRQRDSVEHEASIAPCRYINRALITVEQHAAFGRPGDFAADALFSDGGVNLGSAPPMPGLARTSSWQEWLRQRRGNSERMVGRGFETRKRAVLELVDGR